MARPASTTHDAAVSGMFGRIARYYDVLNHVLSLGTDLHWRKVMADAAGDGPGGLFLDLAAGTLDSSLALRRRHPDCRVLSLDFCLPMLARGRAKLLARGEDSVLPAAADGKRLPLPDACVDAVTIAFGIRNILPRGDALREMLRVLRPGGRACILEFGSGRERIWLGLYNFYLGSVLPLVGRVLSRDEAAYGYLADTIRAFPSAPELAREMEEAGFANVSFRKLTSGIVCLHVGTRP